MFVHTHHSVAQYCPGNDLIDNLEEVCRDAVQLAAALQLAPQGNPEPVGGLRKSLSNLHFKAEGDNSWLQRRRHARMYIQRHVGMYAHT